MNFFLTMIKNFVLIGLFSFAMKINGGIVVSDKMNFELEEKSHVGDSNGDSIAFTFVDASESSSINPARSFKLSSNFRRDELAFRGREFVKPKRSQGNCESTHNSSPPTIVNNIRVIVNGNESQVTPKNKNTCENNVCDVAVSTIKDKDGNLVTTLHLTLITKMNDIKVNDIPIIDGVRGTSSKDAINHPNYSNFIYNSVPQIYRHGPSHFQPSFGILKNNFFRPSATDPYYSYDGGARHGDEFQGQEQSRWTTARDTVDDKIQSPLSKITSK